jgi:glucose-1-phosphate thymidylyltransferase
MKGVILAGGEGTRLYPCTKLINKTCLPLYDKPIIYYTIQTLVSAGLEEILIITGGEHAGDLLKLLGNGKKLGLKEIHYTYQEEPKGIAHGLALAEDFADNKKIVLILADNIFEDSIKKDVEIFEKQENGARLFLKRVSDPERFGVAEVRGDKIINIIEKPKTPISNLAVTGLYMYDNRVFDVIRTLKPSARGEYEITDVNNFYVQKNIATCRELKGFWSDVGTFESLYKTSQFIAEKNQLKRNNKE